MARFLDLFAQLGARDGVRLLDEATAAAMPEVPYPELDPTQALVWYYDRFGDRDGVLGHNGDDPGTAALMFFDPADNTGVLLVANGAWRWPEADRLLGDLFAEAEAW